MGREEQIEEREVLDSIFPDEITGGFYTPSTVNISRWDTGSARMRLRMDR